MTRDAHAAAPIAPCERGALLDTALSGEMRREEALLEAVLDRTERRRGEPPLRPAGPAALPRAVS